MGNTVYDWSPVFDAVNGAIKQYGQRNQYNDMLTGLFGQGAPVPQQMKLPEQTTPVPGPGGTTTNMQVGGGSLDLTPPAINGKYAPGTPMHYDGPLAQSLGDEQTAKLLPMLRAMGPQFGIGMSGGGSAGSGMSGMGMGFLPLLLKSAITPPEYDTTPRTALNPATGNSEQFVTGKNGQVRWLGLAAHDPIKMGPNGQTYDEYATPPGQNFSDKGRPFDSVTGAPNQNVQTYETGLRRAGAPVTNVAVNTEKNFADKVADNLADQFTATRGTAQSAAAAITALNEARGFLRDGMYTGQLAPLQLLAAKMGIVDDPAKIANTEAFQSAMGKQTFSLIKQLGSGTAISNSDREYADKVAGAKITLNEGSLKKILDINERANRALIKQYNATASRVAASPAMANIPMRLTVDEPPPFQPRPAPQAGQPVPGQPQAAPQPVRVNTPDDAMRLPPGTRFVTPDGRVKVRP